MATSYCWHPGSVVEQPLWVLARPLLPDELFSSWLIRNAFALNCDVLDISAQLWPGWRVWTTDIDRNMPTERLPVLSRYSGISVESLSQALLATHTDCLNEPSSSSSGTHPWVLTVGARNLDRSGGLQYCPVCLETDEIPYFRLSWRFGWHTVCEQHQCHLRDRCPHCEAPIQPHRVPMDKKDLTRCAICSESLCRPSDEQTLGDEYLFQQQADQCIKRDSALCFRKTCEKDEWFATAKALYRWFCKVDRTETSGLRDAFQAWGVDMPTQQLLAHHDMLERLSVSDRIQVFSRLWKLLSLNEDDVIRVMSQMGVSSQTISDRRASVPACIEHLAMQLGERERKPRKMPRKPPSGPKPKHDVQRKMKSLIRAWEAE